MHYIQNISIIQKFQLNWPHQINNFLGSVSFLGSTSSFISLNCFQGEYFNLKSLYLETMIIVSTNFLLIFMVFMIMLFTYLKTKRPQKIRFIAAFIAINTFMQPSIISKLLESINCISINNECYLPSDSSINFYSQEHQKWVITKLNNLILYNLEKLCHLPTFVLLGIYLSFCMPIILTD